MLTKSQIRVILEDALKNPGLAGQLILFHCIGSFLFESPFPGNTWLVAAMDSS